MPSSSPPRIPLSKVLVRELNSDALLASFDTILADLDGVVYAGAGAIPFAVEALTEAADAGIRVGYITNNASRTAESVAEHLAELGLHLEADDVVTSPQAAVRLLGTLVAPGSTILVSLHACGMESVTSNQRAALIF